MKFLDALLNPTPKNFLPRYISRIALSEKQAKAWGVKRGDTRSFAVYPRFERR